MKQQNGNISSGVLAAITVSAFFALVLLICGVSYVSNANYGNRAEAGLEAVWTNNQNILGQYTLKVQEIASVPEMYKDDLKEVMSGALTSRYGPNGSQAVMQWIKENNIPFDSSMYRKIQQVMEAGRNEFQAAQTRLIDQKQVYTIALGNVWSGMWLHVAGYPKVDLAKYKPVVAGDTRKQFETGVGGPVQLRAPKAVAK